MAKGATIKWLTGTLLVLIGFIQISAQESISLEGEWKFRLDPEQTGIAGQWYARDFEDHLKLPGSLDEQGIGTPVLKTSMGRLTPETSYVGMAWYGREVTIPEDWGDRRIELFMERVCWESSVYVDGIPAGSRNSLSVPHRYDLSRLLSPGKHWLSVCVDNTVRINIGHTFGNMLWPHALSAETQTNWNGIIGEIKLVSKPAVHLGKIGVFTECRDSLNRVRVAIHNHSGEPVHGKISLNTGPDGDAAHILGFSFQGADTILELRIPFPEDPVCWDEFSPALYVLEVILQAGNHSDTRSIPFGMRDFRASGHHFQMNGRRIMLRGKVCSAVFPLTGYPPMKTEEWVRIFGIYRDYGLNHVRFHSWCPPEAAFTAGDMLGLILQVEPPLWDGYGLVGSIPERAAFILAEVDRIVDTYGNHPSFCLMSMGNELGDGKDPYLAYLVDYLQQKDPRHCYTSTTHPAGMERKDDYFVAAGTDHGICRGMKPFGDFREALDDLDRPLIAHEVGQPAMYPDFREIPKYTGHLKPRYMEVFRDSLEAHHMLDQAEDFRKASGALLVEIYKENIEAQLRTPNVAGFQLLDIQDYPGHGMATIGILNVFLQSKGLISPEGFRQFCSPTVPLIRMPGFTFTNDEMLHIAAEIAHYGKRDLINQPVGWQIRNQSGRLLKSGTLGPVDIPTGGTTSLGSFGMELSDLKKAEQLIITLCLPGTPTENSWKCWVYPAASSLEIPADITVTRTWNVESMDVLNKGGKVLFIPDPGTLENTEKARWDPVFWSYQLFKQPRMMGMLCDPDHPVFKHFPTAFHSDWQWRELLDQSEALVIDATPAAFRPIVQFIPDFNSQQKMSALFETFVGSGKLMVSTLDLLNNPSGSPVAGHLLKCLLEYMHSDDFQPDQTLDTGLLDALLAASEPHQNQAEEPDTAGAVLHVVAAANAPVGIPDLWEEDKDVDLILAQKEGYGYRVEGRCWRDASLAAWFGNHLVIRLRCPANFQGSCYVYMHDTDHSGRAASLFFCGRDQGPLHRYDGDGVWLKFPVDREIAGTGELVFDARATAGPNVTVSRILLLPGD